MQTNVATLTAQMHRDLDMGHYAKAIQKAGLFCGELRTAILSPAAYVCPPCTLANHALPLAAPLSTHCVPPNSAVSLHRWSGRQARHRGVRAGCGV